MPSLCFFDFETRGVVDLRKTGVYRYAEDPRTSVLCFALAIDDGEPICWRPGLPLPKLLDDAVRDPAVEFHAHNANFERAIWRNVFAPRYGLPDLPVTRWRCTAARCAAAGLPRGLDAAAGLLGVPISKDKLGRSLMVAYCKPRKPTKTDPRIWLDDPADLDRIAIYCAQDVRVEREVHRRSPPMVESEQKVWWLDQIVNDRGVFVDRRFIAAVLRQYNTYSQRLNAELQSITGGAVPSARAVAAMVDWLNWQGVNVGDLKAETVDELLGRSDLTPEARRVIEIRSSLSLASLGKFPAMDARASVDGRVRGAHLYWGANTGRFSGQGVQLQNVPRGTVAAEDQGRFMTAICADVDGFAGLAAEVGESRVTDTLSSLIRPTLLASAGKVLIGVDFASIEARVLAWLAGEEELLESFRNGVDVYKQLASKIYNKPIEAISKTERQLGKTAILGLGYGMGANKFEATCIKQGIELPAGLAEYVVGTYRETYPEIVSLWKKADLAAKRATSCPGPAIANRLTYIRQRDWLRCVLPSKRAISYFGPICVEERSKFDESRTQTVLKYLAAKYGKSRLYESTYGGKLIENAVQAIARDLLVGAMFRLHQAELSIVLHIHDEIVVEVERDRADLEYVERLVSVVPDWATGCPIAAEGFVGERYRK